MIKSMKNIILLTAFILLINNSYGQSKIKYNNVRAYTISSEKIEFNNDKNRIFILISNLSCSACINETAYKIDKLRNLLNDSCEYIIITLGDSENILYNRNIINYYSDIFKSIDKFLFVFQENSNTIFEFKRSLNSNYPKIFIASKNSKFIFIENYNSFNVEKAIQILTRQQN